MSAKTHEDQEPTPPTVDFFKKFKPIRLFEPSLGVLGFFIAVCVICSFFFLDYRSVVINNLITVPGQSQRFMWLSFNNNNNIINGSDEKSEKVYYLGEEGNGCDVFDGDWVFDESYPLYQSQDCDFLDGGFRCSENGRPDSFYTKWRWQPKDCNLPRFDAKLMLEKLRNKRLVFVGDSIGRNQWESLLCMLSSVVTNKNSMYEVNGNPITKHTGFLIFKFKDYNCRVEYYRAPFLVVQSRPPAGSPGKIKATLKLDQIDWTSSKWKDADVLVFNTGHWWNYEKTVRGGCYFQEGAKVKLEMSVNDAYRKSIMTVFNWIRNEVDMSKTQVVFRTYAPVHFRGGNWKSGGTCHLETLPELESSSLVSTEMWAQFKIAVDVFSARAEPLSRATDLDILNVTLMSARRKDGHSSVYYLGPGKGSAPIHRQDCSHWCLPGVPDSWNELLYAFFLKRNNRTPGSNSSLTHSAQD